MVEYIIIAVVVIFIAAGLSKVFGLEFEKQHFKHWNLPMSVMYGIGFSELLVGIMLFFPITQYWALVLGSFIMSGAITTCLIVSDYKRAIVPFVLLVILCVLFTNPISLSILTMIVIAIHVITISLSIMCWAYPSTPMNKDGELESLDRDTTVTHRFKTVLGVDYHFVTTGNPDDEVVLLVHGAPESWYSWHNQIIALSKDYYVIALDMKPYGQTGKDLDGDHSFPHIASEIKALLDSLHIDTFHMASHDRGTIAMDHLLSKDGMQHRVLSYVRMQQSFDQPHGDPLPPHEIMAGFLGTMAYKLTFGIRLAYTKSSYVQKPLDRHVVNRLSSEFKYKGIPQAMPLGFKTTSFDKELEDRHNKLFDYMTMPILILQGKNDPGQHPEEYENSHKVGPQIKVQFVECSHFLHMEVPEKVNRHMLDFFSKHRELVGRYY